MGAGLASRKMGVGWMTYRRKNSRELDIEEYIRREFSPRRFHIREDGVDFSPLVSYLDNQLY